MRELGHGEGYRYAHDEPDAHAAGERYLPDEMPDRRYYEPVDRGLRNPHRRGHGAARQRDPGKYGSEPAQGFMGNW